MLLFPEALTKKKNNFHLVNVASPHSSRHQINNSFGSAPCIIVSNKTFVRCDFLLTYGAHTLPEASPFSHLGTNEKFVI